MRPAPRLSSHCHRKYGGQNPHCEFVHVLWSCVLGIRSPFELGFLYRKFVTARAIRPKTITSTDRICRE